MPLFGAFGLTAQLGIAEYARSRKFRERLEHWLRLGEPDVAGVSGEYQ
jgi:hypothetical protein